MLAKKNNLRPLIVHFDNGWNSELAVNNIENIINILGFDLYTLVVDWREFKDLQKSFIEASVVDIETVTDHAIIATLYKLAIKYDIKYILGGSNIATEAILPDYWIYNKGDHINIKDIHNKFGKVPLKTYPLYTGRLKRKIRAKGIETIYPLNFIDYNKTKVKEIITNDLGWRDYGGKHYESIFTRFYQGYILPTKFNIDKRKAHLSTLIFSGQISKQKALEELELPIYNSNQLEIDKEFVLKKLDYSEKEFDQIMKTPRIEHRDFEFEKPIHLQFPFLGPFRRIFKLIKKIK